MRKPAAALLALLLLAACGPAKRPPAGAAAAAVQPALELACGAAFTADTSRAALVQRFGAANVADQTVPGAEGQDFKATVLYPNDPKRRVEIAWWGEARQARPANVAIHGATSDWTAPHGLKLGMSLDEVEKANGKPFKLSGFGWDYGGLVMDWRGGALNDSACRVTAGFDPAPNISIEAVSGEGDFSSDLPAMRAAKARVNMIAVGYPEKKD